MIDSGCYTMTENPRARELSPIEIYIYIVSDLLTDVFRGFTLKHIRCVLYYFIIMPKLKLFLYNKSVVLP